MWNSVRFDRTAQARATVMLEDKRTNACNTVVANNLCIGCGLCVAICPNNNLRIEFNESGEYVATETNSKCPDACKLCLGVCPFFDRDENEDTLGRKLFSNTPGIKHSQEIGYYLEGFVGYSGADEQRVHGASGGMATWMLETFLNENLVDHVACVSATKDAQKLSGFRICSTAEDVRACSGSAYYPVEMSDVIGHILSHEGRYAVIGLPCYCKGIRLAMRLNPKLQRRIKFVLGLVCGQSKSKFFAEYICALGGGQADCLDAFSFRVKTADRPASDFGMKFAYGAKRNLPQEAILFWSEGIGRVWHNRYFTPNACNFCDDVFAELADVCFMDAWLPEYSIDWRGHSIAMVRESNLLDVLKKASENNSIFVKPLSIGEVIKSQASVLTSKRADMKERIHFAGKLGQVVPRKRLSLCRAKLAFTEKQVVRERFLLSQKSGRGWMAANKQLASFQKSLRLDIARLRRAILFERVWHIPGAVARRLRRFVTVHRFF